MQRRLSNLARTLSWHGNQSADDATCPENKTLFEAFEWYTVGDQDHWRRLAKALPCLKAIGIDNIWLPPGCKAARAEGNGYDIYDLYDLGEFEQKGTRATKWGTKGELMELAKAAQQQGLGLYWDAVLNHKAAGDCTERCQAVKVNPKDRRKEISQPEEVEVWTGFNFPGRDGKYSSMRYHWQQFSGIDYDASKHSNAIYKFVGSGKNGWAEDVDNELGNYDYLMFANIDYSRAEVREDVLNWATWITRELGLSGMRLDAIKHYSQDFQRELVRHLDTQFGKDFFIVGEYWKWDSHLLSKVIGKFKGRISLFDVQLVYNLSDISKQKQPDLRKVYAGALVQLHPQRAVTFVANHDTQESQSLPAPVEEWFVPHAYALILFRADGGYPCVFYGDLYGVNGPRPRRPACGGRLARLVLARKMYAYGNQRDYIDQADCIGWTRFGHQSRANGAGLAVIMTNSWSSKSKRMFVGLRHAGEKWTDIMGWAWGVVVIDGRGWGHFPVGPRGMGVWTAADAPGRERVDRLIYDRIEQDEKKR